MSVSSNGKGFFSLFLLFFNANPLWFSRREKRPKLGGGEESLWSLSPEDIVLMAANPNEKTPSLITPTNNADTMFDSAIVSDFHSNAGDDNQSLLSLSAIKSDLGTGKSTGIFTYSKS
jgi:hypothetical protein